MTDLPRRFWHEMTAFDFANADTGASGDAIEELLSEIGAGAGAPVGTGASVGAGARKRSSVRICNWRRRCMTSARWAFVMPCC